MSEIAHHSPMYANLKTVPTGQNTNQIDTRYEAIGKSLKAAREAVNALSTAHQIHMVDPLTFAEDEELHSFILDAYGSLRVALDALCTKGYTIRR